MTPDSIWPGLSDEIRPRRPFALGWVRVQFVDSHAHLTDEAFRGDLDQVLARAESAGVERILTLGTDVETSRAAISVAEAYPSVYAAVGIHPEAVGRAVLGDIDTIEELTSHPRVVAIGEIGLDYYWDKSSAGLQQSFFERQLELAVERNLPVSIHDREAHAIIIETLGRFQRRGLKGVLHSYSGDETMARQATEWGFYLSFGGPITFQNNREALALLPILPVDKLLIETDSPYLSPHPLRGRRNEPARVTIVAERMAQLTRRTIEQVAKQTTENAQNLFGFN